MAGHFFGPERVRLGLQGAVDMEPQVTLGANGRRSLAVEEGREAVNDSLVVHEDVHWLFSGGDKVEQGERLGPLGRLGEALDAGRVSRCLGPWKTP